MPEDKTALGRPKDTPRTILRREIQDTARINRELRSTLDLQIKLVKKQLESMDINLKDRLEALGMLTSASQNQSKSMESIIKMLTLLGEANPVNEAESKTAEQILRGD